jgi:hypothetical protein
MAIVGSVARTNRQPAGAKHAHAEAHTLIYFLVLVVPALFLSAEWCHERTGLELARAKNAPARPRAAVAL